MPFSYDLATDRGKVRLLAADADATTYVFEDEEIDAFLGLEGDVQLAAAVALETLASSEALIKQKIKLLDLQTDGPAVAKELRERAADLRAQVAASGEAEAEFGWVEWVVDPFTHRERLASEGLRDA